ncbi:hypothetical protein J31TS4_39020 [Paenibacillus sp. J31TS4]|uniref:TetR/AcrR family transcriptional regulator n=1 Tax=Paenibacillus sp. J31TS4 TaxID=2807195 RepID=UPI001B1CE847|nr:TetR/AcrR family transcriptional regulator [Paenibacillus sp. J31TS4]GIP40622.1 hypothetical protein J31TS4_39020 [Paenibacillus sp. J31TS4]
MKRTRQEQRAEETKRAILDSAGRLFAEKGFQAVTMREIAKDAGYSHTAIYLYFKDKETLLQQLVIPPLEQLALQFRRLSEQGTDAAETLKAMAESYTRFLLDNRSMADVLFMEKADRVDIPEPELEVNRLRNRLFAELQTAVAAALPELRGEPQKLEAARMYFYYLQGIASTYGRSEEPAGTLLERILPLVRRGTDVLLLGMRAITKEEA